MINITIHWKVTGPDDTTYDTDRKVAWPYVPNVGMKVDTGTMHAAVPIRDVYCWLDGHASVHIESNVNSRAELTTLVSEMKEQHWN